MKSFEMKKGLVGVGINWIKDKNGNTKSRGKNPFKYLAVKISKDGKTIDLFEYKDDSWVSYKDLPKIKNSHFKERDFGREFKLSDFYYRYSYDWDSGKDNFTKWIEEAAKNADR
jgi:hypothetical protein